MPSNLTVAVLADITDLKTKAALAKVALADVNAAVRQQAAAFASVTDEMKGPALAALQSTTAEQAKLKAVVASTTTAIKDQHGAHQGLMGALMANRSALQEVEHSGRAMADALAAGANPLRVLAMEAPRVAQALTELNGIGLSTIVRFGSIAAAVLAAGSAMVFFNQRAKEAEQGADLSARFSAMGTPLPSDKIAEYTEYLRNAGWTTEQLKDITAENIRDITASFQGLKDASPQLTEALVHAIPDLSNLLGQAPVKTAQDLAGALDSLGTKGQEMMDKLHPAPAIMEEFQHALEKNPAQAQAILLNQLQGALTRYSTSLDASRNTTRTWGESIQNALGALDGTGPMDDAATTADHVADAVRRSAQAARDLAAANTATQSQNRAPDTSAIRTSLDAMAEDTAKTHAQILSEQRDYIGKILATDKMEFSQRSALQQEFNRLTTEATIAAGDKLVEAARLSAEKAAAAAGPSRAAQVQAEISTYQALLASKRLTADQQMQVENQVAELQVQLVRRTASEGKKSAAEAWEAYKAGMDRQIEEARGNYAEQIRLIQQEVAEASKLYGQQSRQAQEALKAEAAVRLQASQSAMKATEQQLAAQQDLARAQADFSSIGAKPAAQIKPSIGLAFDHSGLDAQVADEVAQMKSALDMNLTALQASITGKIDLSKTLTQGSDAYNELVKSAAADLAKMAADQKEFADKAVQIQQEAAQKVAESWAKIGAPAEEAFSKIVGAAIGGGRNTRAAMEHAAIGVVQTWAKSGVDMLAHWAASQLGMTAASAAGSAARTAAQTPEEASILSQLATMLGLHVTAEAAKTSATVAGVTARTTAQVTGAAAGHAAEAAVNGPSIISSAARAAAGAYAAVAGIPIVGPFLAPVAAGVAFAAVAAYQGMASAEGGWENVPYDGMPTILHQNEMVLPARVAGPVREMARAGLNAPTAASAAASMPGNSVTNNGGSVSHSAAFTQTNHFHGASDQGAIQSALRSSNQDLNSRFSDWYGNTGTPTLPGRKVRK